MQKHKDNLVKLLSRRGHSTPGAWQGLHIKTIEMARLFVASSSVISPVHLSRILTIALLLTHSPFVVGRKVSALAGSASQKRDSAASQVRTFRENAIANSSLKILNSWLRDPKPFLPILYEP